MARVTISEKDLCTDLRVHYALSPYMPSIKELSSYDDQIFTFHTDDGHEYIVKYYNASLMKFDHLSVIVRVLDALADFKTPVVKIGLTGQRISKVAGGCLVLFDRIPGDMLLSRPKSTKFWTSLGRTIGRISLTMATVHAPWFSRDFEWDPMKMFQNQAHLVLPQAVQREKIIESVRRMDEGLRILPTQLIHSDMNEYNILVSGEEEFAIIDFNDMMKAPKVVDIAHCLGYIIGSQNLNTMVGRAIMTGYNETIELSMGEKNIIYDIIISRYGQSLANGYKKVLDGSANTYVRQCVAENIERIKRFMILGRDRFNEDVLMI